jgi:hypothetical protein
VRKRIVANKKSVGVVAVLVFALSTLASSSEAQSVLFFSYNRDDFSATGNWTPADPKAKPAFPSETQIDCDRSARNCVEATAEYYMGHPHVTLDYLHIVQWDSNGIVATSSDGACMTATMQMSFAEKRIFATHTMKQLDEKTKKACEFFGVSKAMQYVFVLKGSERWTKEHALFPTK